MHLHPEDGMCLMEYVSLLAAGKFSDAPRCTDALLAELARLVNDAMSDGARAGLVRLAPALAALPRTSPAAAPAIVAGALGPVLATAPHRRDLRRHHRRALRRARAIRRHGGFSLLQRIVDGLYRRGPARHALRCAVNVAVGRTRDHSECDSVLGAMLQAAMLAATPATNPMPVSGIAESPGTAVLVARPTSTDGSVISRRESRPLAGRTGQ
jgi:hypothetical protein